MRGDLARREPGWVAGVAANARSTRRFARRRADGRASCCTTGRPTPMATSTSGTRVNKILKDIVVKSKTMAGFDAPYVPGWDCHGMPIEVQIEKTHGKHLPAAETQRLARAYATEQIARQKARLPAAWRARRLGAPLHDDGATATRPTRSARSAKLLEKGYIYRGLKPVNWCFDCHSALAEAEVEYEDRTDIAIDVGFRARRRRSAEARAGVRTAGAAARARSRGDLDHDAVDDSGEPGAQRASGFRLRAGRRRARGNLVLAEDLVAALPRALRARGPGRRAPRRARALEQHPLPPSVLRSRVAGLSRRLT